MEDKDKYTEVLRGSEKRTRFESAQNAAEESRDDHEEQRKQEITNNEQMQDYIGSFADASAAKEERMQEMQEAASSNDSKMAEIIAKMEARDEAQYKKIRIKDQQIGEYINKLTTMSAAGGGDTYNKDRNKKRDRPGPGRGRGGRGGGGRGRGGRGGGSGRPAPAYSM